ncbi:MAG: Pycsar system effector family protein [Bacteroidota bacterium]
MGKKNKEEKELLRREKDRDREERDERRILDRHIDTMFRIAIPNHMQLSMMADQKANILITICAIILGLIIKYVFDPLLSYPAISMSLTCVVTILLAVFATMPKLSTELFKGEEAQSKPNLLFFGYFGQLPYDAYAEKMDRLLKNRPELIDSLLRDLHSLGTVLAKKKYKYLRYSYLAFTVGLVVTTVIFVVTFIVGPQ